MDDALRTRVAARVLKQVIDGVDALHSQDVHLAVVMMAVNGARRDVSRPATDRYADYAFLQGMLRMLEIAPPDARMRPLRQLVSLTCDVVREENASKLDDMDGRLAIVLDDLRHRYARVPA